MSGTSIEQDSIVIVSGLPRSGTSLMMQMLQSGGMEAVTDELRVADENNPRGYLEFEKVKKLKQDTSWLPTVRGKALKLISQLLMDLPGTETYRVLWMERDLDEVLASQAKMISRLGTQGPSSTSLKQAFERHLAQVDVWLAKQPSIQTLRVAYANVISTPATEAERINAFLGGKLDAAAMCAAVDPALYRERKDSLTPDV